MRDIPDSWMVLCIEGRLKLLVRLIFCFGFSDQGDIQGSYDAIDKESFTQTDRQVSKAFSFVNIPRGFLMLK